MSTTCRQETMHSVWDAPYFTGVTTMNIYCTPWCGGHPKPENTIRFHTREEAELAGYRPCRNCCSTLPRGSWEDHKHEIKLFIPAEFNFEENVKYLLRSSNECLHRIDNNRIYKALSVADETPVIEIRAGDCRELVVRFLGDTAPSRKWVRAEVARYVREWFDLDRDIVPFYRLAESDPLLKGPVQSFRGLRTVGIPDLFEAVTWGILGQQINLTYAYTLKRRLVENFGRSVDCEGETYWIYPTPDKIAACSVEDLAVLRMTVKKCEYLIDTAQRIASGELSKLGLLQTGSHQAAEKMLTSIRGIGPWTANYVSMRCLRFPSAFPIDDVGLHNAMKHILGRDSKPSKAEIRQLSAGWSGWESYATFYLWRVLY